MFEGKKAIEISELIKKKEVKVREAVEFFLKRIEEIDPKINAFLTVLEDRAIEEAEKVQQKILKGELKSHIAGVPIAIKDIIVTEGIRTTCGSKILENWIPPYDATVIKRLKEAGAIIIGKTNLDEFAMGSSTENSAFFPTKNPWDTERVPGGSSGGSAAAVGSGEVYLALGTDTGGSIRQPASFCNNVGLCPTYGRVSRYGLVAFASSLDRIGPMTLYVEDACALLEVIAGYDEFDSTCPEIPTPKYLEEMRKKFDEIKEKGKGREIKLGIPKEFFTKDVSPQVKDVVLGTVEKLGTEFGFQTEEISLRFVEYAVPIYYIIAPAEASSNLARYDGVKYGLRKEGPSISEIYTKTRTAGFGDEVKRRIFIGTFVLSSGYYDAYYMKAMKAVTLLKQEFANVFSRVDFIVCPVSPEMPFKIGEKTKDPIKMYLSDVFTIPSSLAGLPAISVPAGFGEENGKKLPIGIQIIGKPFDELGVLTIAKCVEEISESAGKIAKIV